jgi:hydrogenase/urease accessory protein HupE
MNGHRTLCFPALVVAALAAGPALAHSALETHRHFDGWLAGFQHPLAGWDHLLAMVAVGLWAAQQQGRLVWLVPLTFAASMAAGGVAGALGLPATGVELMVALSVPVFALLVIRRARIDGPARSAIGFALVASFAFFHGFAHGQEMPGTASLAGFGSGFLVATALLQGAGVAVMRLISRRRTTAARI